MQLLDTSKVAPPNKVEYINVDARVKIRAAYWQGGKRGLVHIFQGRAEFIEKYQDVISAFMARGFDVVAHDWRDQGLSTRNPHNPLRNIVRSFDEYDRDAQAVIKHFEDIQKPRLLFCHSMGGAIGLPYIAQNSEIFKGAFFSAPLWEFSLPKWAYYIRWLIAYGAIAIGKRYETTIGAGDYRYELSNPFEGNSFTGDRETWNWLVGLSQSNEQFLKYGQTYEWFLAALRRMRKIRKIGTISTPALVTIGLQDTVVSQGMIRKICAKQDNFDLVTFENGHHQDYLETDDIRRRLWDNIDAFCTKLNL